MYPESKAFELVPAAAGHVERRPPLNGRPYAKRSQNVVGMIHAGDLVVKA
jgi:hypothetical protein